MSRGTLVDCVIPEEEPLLGKHELHHCPGQADVTTSTSYVYNEKCARRESALRIHPRIHALAYMPLGGLS